MGTTAPSRLVVDCLVDGIDEMPVRQRESARGVSSPVISFPDARYVISSRPGAAPASWLRRDGFGAFELLPMTPSDVQVFIRQWHEAMRALTVDVEEQEHLVKYERKLTEQIGQRRHLRALAESPLLCALLCALHKDRRAQLPQNRIELYQVALEMLLERRDAEQHVGIDLVLSRTEKTILLQDIAYWLIRNDLTDIEKPRVISRIQQKLKQMTRITASAPEVYQHLLERSGLIREPEVDRVDFIHRTFQEYLAALDALALDDVGVLVEHAHLDQWRQVVIMATGEAYTLKREELLGRLLERSDKDGKYGDPVALLAVACLETSPALSAELEARIRRRASKLLPPATMSAARILSAAGDFAVELLSEVAPARAREAAATMRVAATVGSEEALAIIARHGQDSRGAVRTELFKAWRRFDAELYAATVLRDTQLPAGTITLFNLFYLPGMKYLQISMDCIFIGMCRPETQSRSP